MTIKFCKNATCGRTLSGKQRSYCSAKCKMVVSRAGKGNGKVTETGGNKAILASNKQPVNLFSLFGNDMLPQTSAAIAQIKLHLVTQAEYADVCLSRLTQCKHDIHLTDKLIAQQTLCDIFWRMVDDIQEVEKSLKAVYE